MDTDQVRPPDGPSGELGVLLTPREPIEQTVIRHLGMSLAQAQVDLAFVMARIAATKEDVKLLMETSNAIMTQEGGREDGFVLIPPQALGTLFALLG
jgi:hypothetical protein